ncbi:MAG TPA: N-acetylmuramoyl-L-alanine amidase [Terriglobales bacterium]|nr:N-acetylmuramoyl-L-alanine amidase [Terriglobales bacterium]
MKTLRIQRALRWSAAVFALMLPAMAHARVHKSGSWADSQFAAAEQMQETLEGRPLEDRTRHDYERVINAYRRVYLGAPSSGRADPSVVAAAQMTEEMGRRFNDPDILRSAIQQYEFLRREYPGSKFRFDALFRIGEIYKDDLHDKPRADATFEEFLHRYPRNQFAEAARLALAEPAQRQASLKSKRASEPRTQDAKALQLTSDSDHAPDTVKDSIKETDLPAESADGKPARVLGIRHWSTPDYTRVAIDLEQGVRYQSQRIDNPERVFFDLLNTKLDPKLARTFDVSDGLLKDIRMAQFAAGRTRVVLDLDELSEFQASLVSNPPRLIIDIRNPGIHTADDRGNDIHTPQPTAMPVVKQAASIAETEEDDANDVAPNSLSHAEESPSKVAVEKPVRRNTVVISNGVKKTIVDVDDNEPTLRNLTEKDVPIKDKNAATNNNNDKNVVAKLDHPALDFGTLDDEKPNPVAARPTSAAETKTNTSKRKRKTQSADPDMREAQPTASGERSLTRALGLKIGKIVIDPGHGGHDTGTIGPNGLEEKDLVLDVSRRLGKLLQTRLGAEVIYTRKDDTFIPLETRTAIANEEGADLFVSVHANSSHDPDARGVETYYLNFTSSPDALEVAARENAVSEKSIHELQDLVKKIALKEKIDESQEFAADVQNSLHSGLATKNPGERDRGVKKAPFIVLIGANMPSILAEISFVSNPGDERRLGTSDYRQKIAESLYRGIAKYVSGLSGVKVASKIDKDPSH